MNQIREWEGKCQRCFKETDSHTMSRYDVTLICLECAESEESDTDYKTLSKGPRGENDEGQ
jgi:hypothetical protein